MTEYSTFVCFDKLSFQCYVHDLHDIAILGSLEFIPFSEFDAINNFYVFFV